MSSTAISRVACFLVLPLAIGGSAAVSSAQQPSPAPAATPAASSATTATGDTAAPTLSVDAKLVNIPVVVHDKHGALVQNLAKDQFQLWIDKIGRASCRERV